MADFDYSKLRGRIVEKFGTQQEFAKCFDNPRTAGTRISGVLKGKVSLRQSEIKQWAELLEIEPQDIADYFFDIKVHDGE